MISSPGRGRSCARPSRSPRTRPIRASRSRASTISVVGVRRRRRPHANVDHQCGTGTAATRSAQCGRPRRRERRTATIPVTVDSTPAHGVRSVFAPAPVAGRSARCPGTVVDAAACPYGSFASRGTGSTGVHGSVAQPWTDPSNPPRRVAHLRRDGDRRGRHTSANASVTCRHSTERRPRRAASRRARPRTRLRTSDLAAARDVRRHELAGLPRRRGVARRSRDAATTSFDDATRPRAGSCTRTSVQALSGGTAGDMSSSDLRRRTTRLPRRSAPPTATANPDGSVSDLWPTATDAAPGSGSRRTTSCGAAVRPRRLPTRPAAQASAP